MTVANSNPSRRQKAFTLVELLVVIAIIGVLVGILLPAVGVVRDRANLIQNLNNLRSIGQALQSHEVARKYYPQAVKVSTPQTGEDPNINDLGRNYRERVYSTSWAFELLPYLDEANIYNQRVRTQTASENRTAFATAVGTYANPRRRDAQPDIIMDGGGFGASLDYAANGGYLTKTGNVDQNDPPMLDELRLSYQDDIYDGKGKERVPAMFAYNPKVSGPFSLDWNVRISSANARDGLSHTIAIGDRHIPLPSGYDPVQQSELAKIKEYKLDSAGLAGSSVFTVIRYFNRDPDTQSNAGPVAGTRLSHDPTDLSFYKFGTHNGDMVGFVYLDGHAEYLPTSTDQAILRRLSTMADGAVMPN